MPHSSLHPADLGFIQKLGATDYVVFFYTLVADKVLPHGYFLDVLNLEPHVRRSSDRRLKVATSISETRAEMLLEMQRNQSLDSVLQTASATNQLLVAADIKPRRFRSRWQQA